MKNVHPNYNQKDKFDHCGCIFILDTNSYNAQKCKYKCKSIYNQKYKIISFLYMKQLFLILKVEL